MSFDAKNLFEPLLLIHFIYRFYHTDLQPNIGLFWYFFTEMFEHFRTLFLMTFEMNATILYLFPLTIKLHKKPLLLATILTALITIFRSYPCIGDVAFYMSLFPLWKPSARCEFTLIGKVREFIYRTHPVPFLPIFSYGQQLYRILFPSNHIRTWSDCLVSVDLL